MNSFRVTATFDAWLKALKDHVAKARILARIRAAELGNFGDCAPAGNGVSDMRIHAGPGYRLYFGRQGKHVFILLCAGTKSSQQEDIRTAKALLTSLES